MGTKLKLFDDDDGADNDVEKISKVEINKEFAKRYEHNKKREDLQRLQELKNKGVINDSDDESSSTSSSTTSDEDGITSAKSKKKDLEFFDALIKVRNQDPILKSKEAKLFHSESENEEEDNETDNDNDNDNDEGGEKEKKMKKKKQQMYLKDVMSRHLIEEGPEVESDSDDEGEEEEERKGVKSYSEEQEELRKEFLRAVEEEEEGKGNEKHEEGGDLLKLKERRGRDEEDEDDGVIVEKLDEFFGEDEKLDENEMFLKDYFRKRLWEVEEVKGELGEDEEGLEFSDDEEEIERQEDYEREFNFRFEENAGDRVMGHSRKVEGSVRKKTNARKVQRERKEERMAQAELERKEELKRLKNLKKKEINEKLQKIRETAGIGEEGVCPLDVDDLEEEFDPEEHDKKMKQAFGDDYYDAEDVDPEFGSDQDEDEGELEKPDFDKEDELLGLPKGWDDVDESADGFLSVRERILKQKAENGGDDEQAEDEEDVVAEEGKRKRKRKKPSEVEKAVREQLMEEYYKLDYEDTIGDLKTRFKYKPVKAKKFGLRTKEILMMDDKELNQYVSLKKLAPYREKEWKVPHTKVQQQKERNKALLRGETSDTMKDDRKKRRNDDQKTFTMVIARENQEQKTEDFTADTSKLSRQSKRKRNQAELKLSRQRLMAYGRIPSKPKSKK